MEMSLWMQRSSSLLAEAAKKESFGEQFQYVLPGVERGDAVSVPSILDRLQNSKKKALSQLNSFIIHLLSFWCSSAASLSTRWMWWGIVPATRCLPVGARCKRLCQRKSRRDGAAAAAAHFSSVPSEALPAVGGFFAYHPDLFTLHSLSALPFPWDFHPLPPQEGRSKLAAALPHRDSRWRPEL